MSYQNSSGGRGSQKAVLEQFCIDWVYYFQPWWGSSYHGFSAWSWFECIIRDPVWELCHCRHSGSGSFATAWSLFIGYFVVFNCGPDVSNRIKMSDSWEINSIIWVNGEQVRNTCQSGYLPNKVPHSYAFVAFDRLVHLGLVPRTKIHLQFMTREFWVFTVAVWQLGYAGLILIQWSTLDSWYYPSFNMDLFVGCSE